jgi:hypothetical protein
MLSLFSRLGPFFACLPLFSLCYGGKCEKRKKERERQGAALRGFLPYLKMKQFSKASTRLSLFQNYP